MIAPLVSVIIPVFNVEKYVEQTIQSVLDQTYPAVEIIIVNDGSTDMSLDKIGLFEKDQKIKIISQENTGVSSARNKGMEFVKGDFIAFLDADDVWLPNNLELKIKMLIDNPSVDWVFSDMYLADDKMQSVSPAKPGKDDNILNNILLWDGEVVPGACSNIVIRKKCLLSGIRYDTHLSNSADQDFCIQLASKFPGKRISVPLWYYRQITSSMSRNIKVMENDAIFLYKKADRNNLFKSVWFKNHCFSNMFLILAGSWWKNGKNKMRGLYFIVKALFIYPPNIYKLAKKFF
jgi:glycosyltransferase involved in cell wall biosynthesis